MSKQIQTGGCFACIKERMVNGSSSDEARRQSQHPIADLHPVGNVYLCDFHFRVR